MQIVRTGFNLKYEIVDISSIKPGGEGNFNGVPYKASVKFRATNIIQKEDKNVGLQEIETIVEFKVPCESNKEATMVSELLRKARAAKKPIYIKADIPKKQSEADIYSVISLDSAIGFEKLNNQQK